MEMLGIWLTSWPMMLVFLRLIVRPNSCHARAEQFTSQCRASSVCAARAASSAKNISLFNTFHTFVLNRKRVWLNSLLSLLLWRYTPSSDRLKAWESSREKKIPKSAGASTHPLFHPALEWEWILGGAIVLDDTLHIFMKSFDHLQELGGACYSLQHGKESSPANQVKSLGQVDKAMHNGRLCSRQFLLQLPQGENHDDPWSSCSKFALCLRVYAFCK